MTATLNCPLWQPVSRAYTYVGNATNSTRIYIWPYVLYIGVG